VKQLTGLSKWTGIVVQAILTVAAVVFPSGFALATVPEELFEKAQGAFLEGEALEVPLAIDRRPAL
jgi:hypothetical protein